MSTTPPCNWPRGLDRIAVYVALWALDRIYGGDCETDVRKDFPGEEVECLGCDATRIRVHLRGLLA